jgi:hypothetical protein
MGIKKYSVRFDFEVSAETPIDALLRASMKAADAMARQYPREVFKKLPTGGIVGEPRTVEGAGWRCVFRIDEADSEAPDLLPSQEACLNGACGHYRHRARVPARKEPESE